MAPSQRAVQRHRRRNNLRQASERERINRGRVRQGLEPHKESQWVFPSHIGDQPFTYSRKAFDRIRKGSRLAHFTPHDLRRTATTNMTGKLKISRFIVGRLLNHTDRNITGIYDRYDCADEKRAALVAWARRLEQILAEKSDGKVLTFARG